MTIPHCVLQGGDGFQLIVPQKAQAIALDEVRALGFVFPGCLGGVVRALRQCHIVVADNFIG